jgi:ribosomal protein L14E/L6E/L27E
MSQERILKHILSTDPRRIYDLKEVTQKDVDAIYSVIKSTNFNEKDSNQANKVLEAMENKYEIAQIDTSDVMKKHLEELEKTSLNFQDMMAEKASKHALFHLSK